MLSRPLEAVDADDDVRTTVVGGAVVLVEGLLHIVSLSSISRTTTSRVVKFLANQ